MDESDIVLAVGKQFGIDEALVIYTSKIDIKDSILLSCQFGCPFYGKVWSCPPNSVDIDITRKLMMEYKKALLIIGENGKMDLAKFRKAMLEMETTLRLNNFYKAIALSMGPCDLCETCTLPKACKYPTKKRPSSEGVGIDIISTVRKFKKNMAFLDRKFYSIGIILLE